MPEKDIAVWVGVLSALGAALITTLLTHIFASFREDRSRRRETVSLLTSLDWELQEAAMRIEAHNTTSPLHLPSLAHLIDRALVGRLPVDFLQSAFTVRACLEAGNELVSFTWKAVDWSVAGRPAPAQLLTDLRADIDDWFKKAAEHIGPARMAIRPFLDAGWRGKLLRSVWRVIQ